MPLDQKPLTYAHLDISSYRGISIGARHWYAKLIIDDKHEQYGSKHIRLERPLTPAEAKELNTEAVSRGILSARWRPNDLTDGFNTKEEAIQSGIDKFKSLYQGVLFLGDPVCYSPWKTVIYWEPEFSALAQKMNKIAQEFQTLDGYEGKQQRRVKLLDKRFIKLYESLVKKCS